MRADRPWHGRVLARLGSGASQLGNLVQRARRIAAACERHGVTLPDAAVQFPFLPPAVASVVVGMRTAHHVSSLVGRYTAPVSDDLWTELVADGLLPATALERGT
ncbi:hypothetical protein [Cellulomonas humilata]|uniref:Aryl-alcohol dehydrogenase-like predicted oxidoreductase n=1 Tax=Cellulomonas humilata TaxID=144055 RepID=A0ABU0EFS1_9CELL|nr:hypothetical protein [Cellulomonas humilata]MDQ0373943.1 aryl-alcohol dehydrogenase-like predicted oxidoreductase [Cellulomonas humilata]